MVKTTSLDDCSDDEQKQILSIAEQFAIEGKCLHVEELHSGHINSTYRITCLSGEDEHERYILQSINRNVFKDPYAVMSNVERVTKHINLRVFKKRKDAGGQTLNLIPTRCGKSWTEDDQGAVWRCYNFIEGCVTYDVVENTRQAYQAAFAFGAFQNLISDLDATKIKDTIPHFHDTPRRFQRLLDVIANDPKQRAASVTAEIEFIKKREPIVGVLMQLVQKGEIPIRITHNDTKINNVMIDEESDQAVCVIDLDTVMPGIALYDFGDLVRTATSPAEEDEKDLSKVQMQMPMFEALVEGYLDAASSFLNEMEMTHLVLSGKLMTLEVGIRFLTDYLEGDVYFKTDHAQHNLERCRTQLTLVERIEDKESEMQAFVKKVIRSKKL